MVTGQNRWSQLRSAGRLARLQRSFAPSDQLPVAVAVLPLDTRSATSPITATLASLMQSTLPDPLVAVDADGVSQPLRRLLSSSGAGDLIGLAASHDASLSRARVTDFVDMGASVPLATCWLDGPGAIPPESLRSAVWKLRRRFPSLIIDVPHGVPKSTIAVATGLASHIVLVGDPQDLGHSWLHQGKSILADAARRKAVTVVAVGGSEESRAACEHDDVVPIPQRQTAGYRAGSVSVPTGTDELFAFTTLLQRVTGNAPAQSPSA